MQPHAKLYHWLFFVLFAAAVGANLVVFRQRSSAVYDATPYHIKALNDIEMGARSRKKAMASESEEDEDDDEEAMDLDVDGQ